MAGFDWSDEVPILIRGQSYKVAPMYRACGGVMSKDIGARKELSTNQGTDLINSRHVLTDSFVRIS